jgi:glycosyltransferase involved in cell wall biosynthesis
MSVDAAAPLRILWLTSEYFPPETGGTGMVAGRLTRGLAAAGADVRVATRQVLPRCAKEETVGGVRVRRLDPPGLMKGAGWRAFPAMLSFIARLALLLIAERNRYDVVVVSGIKTIPLTAVPVCRWLRKKCVLRLESPFELVEPISAESLDLMHGVVGGGLSRVLKALQRAMLKRADCAIAISGEITARLGQFGSAPKRVVRIPNVVDLSIFSPVAADRRCKLRERFGFTAETIVALYVGRLSRAKGVMMLIEGWSRINAKYPQARLVMVGGGADSWDNCEADIVEYVRAHALGGSVTLAGHSTAVHEYLQAADLFVSPSDYEGFSLTLVEAMGCALPIVTTAVGAAPEIIDDGVSGFLCAPKNEQAWQTALETALEQQMRWSEVGGRARAVAEAFDIPQVVRRYLELLRELCR